MLENRPNEAYGTGATDCVGARLKLSTSYSILALVCTVLYCATTGAEVSRRKAMRKVLVLVLISLFFAAACSKSEETPAPEASAAAAESPAAAASPADAAPAASPAQ